MYCHVTFPGHPKEQDPTPGALPAPRYPQPSSYYPLSYSQYPLSLPSEQSAPQQSMVAIFGAAARLPQSRGVAGLEQSQGAAAFMLLSGDSVRPVPLSR